MYKERLKLGEPKLIKPDNELPFTVDGSASPIVQKDGSVLYFFTDLGGKPFYRVYSGDACNPFVNFEFEFKWDFNEYPDVWPCGIWAQSIYQCDDGTLIGFCHREDLNREDKNYFINYHIGLGISEDGGHNWFYAGDICGTGSNYIPLYHANMGGCPTIVKDGYFYTYYNEFTDSKEKMISAARFSVEETIAMLKQHKLPKVYKYSGNGIWDTPGIGHIGAPIIQKSPYSDNPLAIHIDSHSKATYCEALDCYLMTFQTGGTGELIMYFSNDGINWNESMIIDVIDDEHKGEYMQPYSTFVDISGSGRADCFSVGNKFMLHFLHKGIKDYTYDEYYVREIEIV